MYKIEAQLHSWLSIQLLSTPIPQFYFTFIVSKKCKILFLSMHSVRNNLITVIQNYRLYWFKWRIFEKWMIIFKLRYKGTVARYLEPVKSSANWPPLTPHRWHGSVPSHSYQVKVKVQVRHLASFDIKSLEGGDFSLLPDMGRSPGSVYAIYWALILVERSWVPPTGDESPSSFLSLLWHHPSRGLQDLIIAWLWWKGGNCTQPRLACVQVGLHFSPVVVGWSRVTIV